MARKKKQPGRVLTQADWPASTSPKAMLSLAQSTAAISPRKLRLFALACCRRATTRHLDVQGQAVLAAMEDYASDWFGTPGAGSFDARCEPVLDVVERHADGLATDEELQVVHDVAWAELDRANDLLKAMDLAPGWVEFAARAANAVTAAASYAALPEVNDVGAAGAARAAADFIGSVAGACAARQNASARAREEAAAAAEVGERGVQCGLLRDLLDILFHPVVLDPAWLTGNEGSVARVARATYHEQAFDQLPILADALEDAGCDNPHLLAHLRSPGPHVRGCWALDLILARE